MRSASNGFITFFFLLLGFALLQMGNGLQGTLLAVRADGEGFSAISIGLIMSGFYIGMSLGSFSGGRLIEQAGHIRVFAALASLGSAAALVHLLLIDPVAWVLVRTVTGFCFAGLIIVVESWLNASATSDNRGTVLSVYAVCSMAAGVLGQFLFTLASPAAFTLFVLVSILMSLALVPISLSRATAPISEGDQESPSIRRLWEFSPFGAIAMLLAGATFGAFFGLAPLYAQRNGFGQSEIAILMAAFTLGGLAFQFPIGMLSDRVNRRMVVIGAAALACLLLIGLALGGTLPKAVIYGAFFAIGAAILPAFSVIVAHVNDRAPLTALIAVSGGLILMQGIGAAAGPVVAGGLMERWGPAGFILFIAALQGLTAIYGLARIFIVEGPALNDKTGFTAAPITPVVSELELQVYEEAAEEAAEDSAEAPTEESDEAGTIPAATS